MYGGLTNNGYRGIVMELLVIFAILTIIHPIADFGTPYRKWGNFHEKWWTFFLSEYFLALNPFHFLWDMFSPFRRHPQHIQQAERVNTVIMGWDLYNENWEFVRHEKGAILKELPSQWSATPCMDERQMYFHSVNWWFWRWLAVDQVYHMITNLLFALLLVAIFW